MLFGHTGPTPGSVRFNHIASMVIKVSLIPFFVIFAGLCSLPALAQIPLSPCIYGRAVGGYDVPPPPPNSNGGAHPSAWPTGTLDGTCHLGSVQTLLPSWYAAGYLAAPDDETYNGFPWTSGAIDIVSGGVGKSCGECFQLFGDKGTITVMAADVCDKPCRECGQCQGSLGGPKGPKDVPTFSVHSAALPQLTNGNNGGVPIAIRKVTCDMSGTNVGFVFGYANEGNPQMTYFRLRIFGSRVGIADVQIRGPASGPTQGNWVSLNRHWEGLFNWTSALPIGGPFEVRVTSIFDETLTYPSTVQEADLLANKAFSFGTQFTKPTAAVNGGSDSDSTCRYPGSDPSIFGDRLGGDNFNYWYDYGSSVSSLNLDQSSGCFAGKCISFGASAAFTMIQLAPHGGVGFTQSQYSTLSFRARIASGTANARVSWTYTNYTNPANPTVTSNALSFTVNSSWTQYTYNTADFWTGMGNSNWMRTFRIQLANGGSSATIYLDDIGLLNPQQPQQMLYWVADPALAGPPAPLGTCGYAGPKVCCYENSTAISAPQGPTSPSPPSASVVTCSGTTTAPSTTTTKPSSTSTTNPSSGTTTPSSTTTKSGTTSPSGTTTQPASSSASTTIIFYTLLFVSMCVNLMY